MESLGGFRFGDMNKNVRKKRSNPSRRPREETPPENRGNSSLSSSPISYKGSKESSDDNNGYDNTHCQKEINLNAYNTRASYTDLTEAGKALKISGRLGVKESKVGGEESRRSSEGSLARESSGKSEVASAGKINETVVKRVKLKVGGVVRTLHAKSASDAAASVAESSSMKSLRLNQKQISQENSNEDHSPSPSKRGGLRGIPWKDFSKSGFHAGKVDSSKKTVTEEGLIKKSDTFEPVRKSKRVPKRRLLDGEKSDGDDDEIRYLEKLKTSKIASPNVEYDDEDESGSRKSRKISKVLSRSVGALYDVNAGNYGSSRSSKESNSKSKLGREYEDSDYADEEEQMSDDEPVVERKKQRKEVVDMAVTTRQRAIQTGKDVSSSSSAGFIEFPYGLPPAPPRKQKDKLSEVEQQLKKAEAAQRRKIQAEKAARESEAEAIRKILGQDSSRKKRENKVKQRQEEMAQERTANAVRLASNTVRWIIGPSGTVVTFPDEMGLPTIFEPKTCSYPPPREKCAGPSCSNPYKYRDSTSKLPLCSLQCYKAVHEKILPLSAC